MKFFIFVITLIICQYFISQIAIDARPTAVKKFSWSFPIHDNQEDELVQHHVKRKLGPGWGKRSSFMIDEHPENAAHLWFENK